MHKSVLTIAMLAISFLVKAQVDTSSRIQVEIKLVQKQNGELGKIMAVSLSIVNDSDSDVYIPGYLALIAPNAVVYKKEDNGYELASFYPQFVSCLGSIPQYRSMDTMYNTDKSRYSFQDSMFQVYLGTLAPFNMQNVYNAAERPFFLKAHQAVDDYSVISLEELLKTNAKYKICFEPQNPQNADYLPEVIFGYHRYTQNHMESNTIYFQQLP